jgi:putative polymerase
MRIFFAQAIIVGTLIMNPLLAVVNGHAATLTPGIVAVCQTFLVASAFACAWPILLTRGSRWTMLMIFMVAMFCLSTIGRGVLIPKYLGDMLLMPAFILLGMMLDRRQMGWLFFCANICVAVVAIYELLMPVSFADLFKVPQYYVATRGFDDNAFWADNGLFLSSQRPGEGRLLLPSTGLHRASSLFLEPVALGNWCILATICLFTFWRDWGLLRRALTLVATAIALVACDGRLAMACMAVLLLILPLTPRLPPWISVLTLPLVVLLSVVAMPLGLERSVGDTLSGRWRAGTQSLMDMNWADIIGFGGVTGFNYDSGISYFILSQSLPVLIVTWLILTLQPVQDQQGKYMKMGVALFISLCLPISNSLFSIKTGALMWAIYGNVVADRGFNFSRT